MTAARGRSCAWAWFGLALVLAGAVAWIYARTAGFGFVMFDDDINLYLNPMLGAPGAHALAWMFGDASRMLRYLPLGWLGFSTVFAVGGLEPAAYHVANLGLHALNAVLAFAVFARLAPPARRKASGQDEAWRAWAAASGAALWALHPLRVEAVAWASGQLYLHATAWALASTLAFLTVLDRREEARPFGGWLAVSVTAYAASLLAYPLAFGLPVALAVAALWRGDRGRLRTTVLAAPHAVCSATALGVAVVIRIGGSGLWNPAASATTFGVGARVSQAAYLVVRTLGLTLLPGRLTPADDLLEHFAAASPLFLGCGALVVGLSVGLWVARRRFPGLGWLGIAYLGMLVPFLGFLEHPYYPCDRYTYLPGLVLGAGAALGLGRLSSLRWRVVAIPAVLAVCGVWAVQSRGQAAIWRDTGSLFGRIVERGRGERVRTLFRDRLAWDEALLGQDAESGHLLERLLRAHPDDAGLVAVRARIEALQPANPAAFRDSSPLAREVHRMALEDARVGRLFDAEQRLRYVLTLSPRFSEGRYNFAIVLARRGHPLEAVSNYLWATAPGSGLRPTQLERVEVLALMERAFEREGQVRWALACGKAGRSRS